jgi:hypothetical protein
MKEYHAKRKQARDGGNTGAGGGDKGGGNGGNNNDPNKIENLEFEAYTFVIQILSNLRDALLNMRDSVNLGTLPDASDITALNQGIEDIERYFIFIRFDHPQHLDEYESIIRGLNHIIDILPNGNLNIDAIDVVIRDVENILENLHPNFRD